jgi:hypothetical protein
MTVDEMGMELENWEGEDEMDQQERIKHILYLATFALLESGGEKSYSREQIGNWLGQLAGSTTVIGVKSDEDNVVFFLVEDKTGESLPC